MQQIRRIDWIWRGEDVEVYEKLKNQAIELNKEIPEFVKEVLGREINRGDNQ